MITLGILVAILMTLMVARISLTTSQRGLRRHGIDWSGLKKTPPEEPPAEDKDPPRE